MPDHNPISTTTPIGVGPLGIALHADRKKRHSTRSAFACLRASRSVESFSDGVNEKSPRHF
jgi:hypothetical protein